MDLGFDLHPEVVAVTNRMRELAAEMCYAKTLTRRKELLQKISNVNDSLIDKDYIDKRYTVYVNDSMDFETNDLGLAEKRFSQVRSVGIDCRVYDWLLRRNAISIIGKKEFDSE